MIAGYPINQPLLIIDGTIGDIDYVRRGYVTFDGHQSQYRNVSFSFIVRLLQQSVS